MYATNAQNTMSLFLTYLKAGEYKDLFDDKLALRAVKIAFHINKNGIKRMFQQAGPHGDETAINDEIKRAANQKQAYSAKLTALRLHHQLTMLQIEGYKSLARQLAYPE
jgi:hypothetical protein